MLQVRECGPVSTRVRAGGVRGAFPARTISRMALFVMCAPGSSGPRSCQSGFCVRGAGLVLVADCDKAISNGASPNSPRRALSVRDADVRIFMVIPSLSFEAADEIDLMRPAPLLDFGTSRRAGWQRMLPVLWQTRKRLRV